MAVLLVFNFIVVSLSSNPAVFLLNMTIGGVLTVLVAGVIAALITSVNILGSGLNTAGTSIMFGFAVLLGLLFQITFSVAGFNIPLGVGLLQNLFSVFELTDLWGIPYFLISCLGLLILVSGLQTIQGGGSEA